jgi:hypothetical protein
MGLLRTYGTPLHFAFNGYRHFVPNGTFDSHRLKNHLKILLISGIKKIISALFF